MKYLKHIFEGSEDFQYWDGFKFSSCPHFEVGQLFVIKRTGLSYEKICEITHVNITQNASTIGYIAYLIKDNNDIWIEKNKKYSQSVDFMVRHTREVTPEERELVKRYKKESRFDL